MKAAALVAAEDAIEARQSEIEEEATLVAENWLESQNAIAQSVQLQESQSQLTKLDSNEFGSSDSFLSIDKLLSDNNSNEEEESSSSNSDGEPRHSSRSRKPSRTAASQLSQDRAVA